MTETLANALEEAEPLDPDHYFGAVKFDGASYPTYGLVEAQLPPEKAPAELDEARVFVAEKVDDADEFGARPVLTVLFEEVDDIEVEAGEAQDEINVARAEILIGNADESFGLPNSITHSPSDMAAIIKRAMTRYGLDRVTTTPEHVAGVEDERYQNTGALLIDAGFRKVSTGEGEQFELVRHASSVENHEDSTPELIAA